MLEAISNAKLARNALPVRSDRCHAATTIIVAASQPWSRTTCSCPFRSWQHYIARARRFRGRGDLRRPVSGRVLQVAKHAVLPPREERGHVVADSVGKVRLALLEKRADA